MQNEGRENALAEYTPEQLNRSRASVAELTGDGRLLIEKHRGVLEYSTEHIVVYVSFGLLEVCGCNLCFQYMTKERLLICGRVNQISLLREG